jgi:putative transposase
LRRGDRQLNSALHTIAITQIRIPSSRGHRYYKSKIAKGETPRRRHGASETPRRPPLADHDQQRTGGGPGRTTGDDSAIQRGWPNPNDQLFGQVTSRTRHPGLYGGRTSRLTNTEAPKGTDLSRWTAGDRAAGRLYPQQQTPHDPRLEDTAEALTELWRQLHRPVLLPPVEAGQFTLIRYTERLPEAGAKPSIGSVGDSYDNAMAKSIIGLFKTEVILCQGPWRIRDAVEMAILEWVDWYNNRRLFEALGDIPPAKAESAY